MGSEVIRTGARLGTVKDRTIENLKEEYRSMENKLSMISSLVSQINDDLESGKSINNCSGNNKYPQEIETFVHNTSELQTQVRSLKEQVQKLDESKASAIYQLDQVKKELMENIKCNQELNVKCRYLCSFLINVKELLESGSSRTDLHVEDNGDHKSEEMQVIATEIFSIQEKLAQKDKERSALVATNKSLQEELVAIKKNEDKTSEMNRRLNDQWNSFKLFISKITNDRTKPCHFISEVDHLNLEDSALASVKCLVEHLNELSNTLNENESQIDHLSLHNSQIEGELQTEKVRCEDYIHKNIYLQKQLDLLSASVNKLTMELETRVGMTEDLSQEKALAEALAHEISEAEDAASDRIHKLSDRLHRLQDDLSVRNEAYKNLEEAKEELEGKLRLMEVTHGLTLKENQNYMKVNADLQKQLDPLSASINKLTMELETRLGMTEDLSQEMALAEALAHEISEAEDAALDRIHKLSDRLHQLQDDLSVRNEAYKNLEEAKEELEKYIEDQKSLIFKLSEKKIFLILWLNQMSGMEDHLVIQVESLSNELHQTKYQLSRLQSEYELLMVSYEGETNVHDKISDLENEKNALSASLEQYITLVEKLSKENEVLVKELQDNKCTLDTHLEDANENNLKMSRKIEMVEAELIAKDQFIKERELLINKLECDLEKTNTELSVACVNLEIETQKLLDANQEIKTLRREVREAKESSNQENNQMKQVKELKQLLASANAREEEARKIALATDEEMKRKEKEYEKAVIYATEWETAAKEWEQKYQNIASHESNVYHHDINEVLGEIEKLLQEKMELEKLLEQASSEEGAKLKFLEQALTEVFYEADSLMRGLKQDVPLKETELQKYKQDTQATRKTLIVFEEQVKSDHTVAIDADEKVLQLSEQLSNAEETSSQLTKKLTNLEEECEAFKEHVNSSRESYKHALEAKLLTAKDEVVSSKEKLHDETSKAPSFGEIADISGERLLDLSSGYLQRKNLCSRKRNLL
jgi:hypothetical protein